MRHSGRSGVVSAHSGSATRRARESQSPPNAPSICVRSTATESRAATLLPAAGRSDSNSPSTPAFWAAGRSATVTRTLAGAAADAPASNCSGEAATAPDAAVPAGVTQTGALPTRPSADPGLDVARCETALDFPPPVAGARPTSVSSAAGQVTVFGFQAGAPSPFNGCTLTGCAFLPGTDGS